MQNSTDLHGNCAMPAVIALQSHIPPPPTKAYPRPSRLYNRYGLSLLYLILTLLILIRPTLAQTPGNLPETASAVAAQAPENKPAVAVYVTGDVPDYQKEFLSTYLLS